MTNIRVVISGSRSIKSLDARVVWYLDKFMADGVRILIGDAYGVDRLVQAYLASKNYDKVIVFYSSYGLRNNLGNWNTFKVSGDYTKRDEYMHRKATCGLAIWDGKSRGTFRNVSQLQSENKKVIVITIK